MLDNKHIKDFCVEVVHFIVIPAEQTAFYISYEAYNWFEHPASLQMKVNSIIIYDDFIEYEKVRLKALYSNKEADIPNQN